MSSKKVCLKEENILKLVLDFLSSRNYHTSARSLEKESGVITNGYSESINFFRELVLDGDWLAVREFGEPLADVSNFDYRRFHFLLAKQEYLEMLFEQCEGTILNEQSLKDRLLNCLKKLERFCRLKEEYNKLAWYLSVPSLRTDPEFSNWSVDSSRLALFEEMLALLKQFVPIGDQSAGMASEGRLLSLLFKGLLYENCIEFCEKQAMKKTVMSDFSLTNLKVDLFRKQSFKSSGSFYSWLHSLSTENFAILFEPLNFELQIERQKQTKIDFKNNFLSRSLTIEDKLPSKVFVQKDRNEQRKRFKSDYLQSRPDFDLRDISQSFAEFEFVENGEPNCPHQKLLSNEQEIISRNGNIYPSDVPSSYTSPRKVRRDQQDLVLQQLEEHKQRQRELYEKLSESASLAGGRIKDIPINSVIPDESTNSLEAVRKSIQNLKLLTETFECPKSAPADNIFGKDGQKLNPREKEGTQTESPKQFCPNTVSIPKEMLTRKSSSSTPGSAALPKTPVNTCLPPGLVKLTDGSGTFNTSTPRAERQTFTTPLPTSPVTSEQRHARVEALTEQTPKAAGKRQIPVRRSLVNTVFQDETFTVPNLTNVQGVIDTRSSNPKQSKTSPATQALETNAAFVADSKELRSDSRDPGSQARNTDGNLRSNFPTTVKTESKSSRLNSSRINAGSSKPTDPVEETVESNCKNVPSQKYSSPKKTNFKDPRTQDFVVKNTSSIQNPQPLAPNTCMSNFHSSRTITRNNGGGTLQNTTSAQLNFQKSGMLSDTQAIRAAVFHPSGKYFAVGTNSKALKICRLRSIDRASERNDQELPALEVVCQKTSVHKGSVYCIAFSSNGDIIATGSNDKTIKLSQFTEDTSLKDVMELSIHHSTVRDLTFVNTAAGSHPVLASGGAGGGLIHLSDCFTGQAVSSLQGHAGNVMAVYASDQAHLLCSGSADKTVRLWDLRMAKCIGVFPTSSCVTSVCFNYGTTHSLLLASADDSGQCIVYDVGARKSVTSFNPHEMDCRSIRFSPDSQYILTGSYDTCVAITAVHYNSSDEMLSNLRVVGRHRDKVIQCRWHPSEYTFLSTSADKTVVLWEPLT